MKLVGSNPAPNVMGLDELPGKSNYFIGKDPKKWRTNVPIYAKVRYHDVYPGVDLVYYGNQHQLEYDLIVAPGVDPSVITLAFHDADELTIDDQGNLILRTAGGTVIQKKPLVYQEIDGSPRFLTGRYVLKGSHRVGFSIPAYDVSKPLIIDPVLSYSTYLGGNGTDTGVAITVDGVGNAYVTGTAFSTNFPTANPFQAAKAGSSDAFVTKLDPVGSTLVYSTYLGGSGPDKGEGIVVDAAGDAYVTGSTNSGDFPTVNPFQAVNAGGGSTAFVTKLNAGGSGLIYSSYLGGSSFDQGHAIAVDTTGNAYVTGNTWSTDFPTVNPLQAAHGGNTDAFVTKVNTTGSAPVYSTYLGGISSEEGHGIAVDTAGNAYVTGQTWSTDFPTVNPLQGAFGGITDVFVTKINPAGSAPVYSTYLGGNGQEIGRGIAVDAAGNVFVTGHTSSTNFPTVTPLQSLFAGFVDAFVAKVDVTGSSLVYSTYLGGSGDDRGHAIALDSTGSVNITGTTFSINFPIANPFQATNAGNGDAFVTQINAAGSALVDSTYLGGDGAEEGHGIAVDAAGSAYVTGRTDSTDFPTASPFQAVKGSGIDAFVAKIVSVAAILADLSITKTDSPDPVRPIR
jgi:hypothetical protein